MSAVLVSAGQGMTDVSATTIITMPVYRYPSAT